MSGAANLGTVSGMATKSKTKKAEPESQAAATDAERQEARIARRDETRKAQQLAQGEKQRQKSRAEIDKIREDSLKVLADKA